MQTHCATCPKPRQFECVNRDAIANAISCAGIDCSKACEKILAELAPVMCDGGLYPQDTVCKALASVAKENVWYVDGKPLSFAAAVLLNEYRESPNRVKNVAFASKHACEQALASALGDDPDTRLSLGLPVLQIVYVHTVRRAEEMMEMLEAAVGIRSREGFDREGVELHMLDRRQWEETALKQPSVQASKAMKTAIEKERLLIERLRIHLLQNPKTFVTRRERDLALADLNLFASAYSTNENWFRYARLYHLDPVVRLPVCIRLSSRPDGKTVNPADLTNYHKSMAVRAASLMQSYFDHSDGKAREEFVALVADALEARASAAIQLWHLKGCDRDFHKDSGLKAIDDSSRQENENAAYKEIRNLFFIYSSSDFKNIIRQK
jgi:hypothetical protein